MEITNQQQQLEFIRKNFLTSAPIDNSLTDSVHESTTDIFPAMESLNASKTDTTDNIDTDILGYKYLDDVILSNSLALFPRNLNEKYTIHLCLFSINTDLRTPFLQFMFSKDDSVYEFPHIDLNMENIQESASAGIMQPEYAGDTDQDSDNDEESVSGIDAEFFTQCSELFEKTITIPDIDIHSLYRGFLEDDQDNTQLYVFFDCTGLHIELHNDGFSSGDKILGIVDELNTGTINNVEIKQPIIRLFNENVFAKTLNTDDGKIINHPIIAYICSQVDDDATNDVYVNEYYTDDHDYNEVSLLTSTVNHNRYHDIYMFSKVPINGEYKNIIRFALFYEEINDHTENMTIVGENNDNNRESGSSDDGDNDGEESGSSDNDGEESGSSDDSEESGSDGDGDGESGSSDDGDGDEESGSDGDGDGESGSSDDGDGDEESGSSDGDEDEESGSDGDGDDDEESGSSDDGDGDEESGSSDDGDGDEESGSSDESIEDVELEENTVFTFQEDGKTYYGTYSMETFTEF
jgi:hypothetical protein